MKNPCYPHVKNTVNILHASAKAQKELKLNTWTIVTPFGDQDAGQEKKLIEYVAENSNHVSNLYLYLHITKTKFRTPNLLL
jgi:hypothetical protein